MTGWYSERMTATGDWSPQVTPSKPIEKKADGAKSKYRNVTEIPTQYEGLGLTDLQKVLT